MEIARHGVPSHQRSKIMCRSFDWLLCRVSQQRDGRRFRISTGPRLLRGHPVEGHFTSTSEQIRRLHHAMSRRALLQPRMMLEKSGEEQVGPRRDRSSKMLLTSFVRVGATQKCFLLIHLGTGVPRLACFVPHNSLSRRDGR